MATKFLKQSEVLHLLYNFKDYSISGIFSDNKGNDIEIDDLAMTDANVNNDNDEEIVTIKNLARRSVSLVTSVILVISGLWLGTRTGAGGTATLTLSFFGSMDSRIKNLPRGMLQAATTKLNY